MTTAREAVEAMREAAAKLVESCYEHYRNPRHIPSSIRALPLPPDPEPNEVRARKIGGSYQADGTIVARFKTQAGAERVVFEFDEPKGMLHIFAIEQIVFTPDPAPREGVKDEEREDARWLRELAENSRYLQPESRDRLDKIASWLAAIDASLNKQDGG